MALFYYNDIFSHFKIFKTFFFGFQISNFLCTKKKFIFTRKNCYVTRFLPSPIFFLYFFRKKFLQWGLVKNTRTRSQNQNNIFDLVFSVSINQLGVGGRDQLTSKSAAITPTFLQFYFY